jgi:DNA-binding transcriptional LysR family regulator
LDERGVPTTLEDLEHHRCVVGTESGPPLKWWVRDGDAERELEPPPTHQLSDGEAMVDAAAAGLGLVQLPISLVRDRLTRGELVAVLPQCTAAGVEIHAVWPHKRQLSPRLRYVVDQLVERAARGVLD